MRQWLVAIVLVMGLLGGAQEGRAQFCPGISPWVFDDVLASDPFCGFVTKMAQQNVTLGCVVIDANHRLYCPNDNVTRKQMAAFMVRLGDALFPLTCSSGQVMKWNGTAWACASDNTGGGGGTVTSVMAGTGLQGSPNPITGAGSLSIAASYQLPQACSNGQVPKSNGSGGWTCAADNTGGSGTVTSVTAGTGLTGGVITATGTIAADTTYLQRRVSSTCAVGSSIRAIAADGTVTCQTDNAGPANAFVQNGNSFAAAARMGSADFQEVQVIAGNKVGMRIIPSAVDSPSVFGGYENNSAYAGVMGATVAGGGAPGTGVLNFGCGIGYGCINGVTDHYGTIGGGAGNLVGNGDGDLGNARFATVSGGVGNWAYGDVGTVAGGWYNRAIGPSSVVGGGAQNDASGQFSVIAGGLSNQTTIFGSRSFIAGGTDNIASGARSFAAGVGALADFDGCVVFANGHTTGGDTSCGGANRFVVRAFGGYFLFTGLGATGAYLAPGSSTWAVVSDVESKHNLIPVDPREVLEKVTAMPISTWRWKAEEGNVVHMGPMAQEFHAAFGLGDSDKRITTVDADGVALAAIQGLNSKLEAELAERDARVADQAREIAELKRTVELLVARMATGEQTALVRQR